MTYDNHRILDFEEKCILRTVENTTLCIVNDYLLHVSTKASLEIYSESRLLEYLTLPLISCIYCHSKDSRTFLCQGKAAVNKWPCFIKFLATIDLRDGMGTFSVMDPFPADAFRSLIAEVTRLPQEEQENTRESPGSGEWRRSPSRRPGDRLAVGGGCGGCGGVSASSSHAQALDGRPATGPARWQGGPWPDWPLVLQCKYHTFMYLILRVFCNMK